MVDESILSKIKKIRELAKKNDNENEAAAAAAFAQELLLRHNISEKEVDSAHIEREEEFIHEYYRKHMSGQNVKQWKIDLAFVVARTNLCRVLFGGNGEILHWYGKKSNIEVAQFLYETIVADIERIAEERWSTIEALRKLEKQTGTSLFKAGSELRTVHGKSWKNSFYWGAKDTVSERLQENLNTLQITEPKINALVLVSDAGLKEFVESLNPHLKKKRHRTYKKPSNTKASYSGFESGKEAGKEVQFKRGIGAGGSHAPKLIGTGE